MSARYSIVLAAMTFALQMTARAVVVDFFNSSQSYALVLSSTTSDTIQTEGYRFTYTRDKLFTGGLGGGPIGRPVSIDWPAGLQAQAVTTGPIGPAQFTISRADGDVFDLSALTFKLLANTAGAGGTVEIMPLLNGQDGLPNPATFDATGISGMSFSYDTTTPLYLGNTSSLKGFDTYIVSLYVDFAITDIKLDGKLVPEPTGAMLSAAGSALLLVGRRRRRDG